MKHQSLILLFCGISCAAFIGACAMSENENVYESAVAVCPEGFVETPNTGIGEASICCPEGTLGQDGFCVDAPAAFEADPAFEPVPTDVVAEGTEPLPVVKEAEKMPAPETFIYLTAPEGKGSAYCPTRSNSLAWNGVQFKCCGYQRKSVVVPSRSDSVCCPVDSISARWVGKEGFDYECCPNGTVEVKNEGIGDKYICCAQGQIAKDGACVDKPVISTKEDKILLSAPNGKGQAYCPKSANSLAWNSVEFQCCGNNMKSVVVPSRDDSICCPVGSEQARWVGKKWNDFECCLNGTVETKNEGDGDKYICCPEGDKALNGECLGLK